MRKYESDNSREVLTRIKSAAILSLLCIAVSAVALFIMAILIQNEILPSFMLDIGSIVVIIPSAFLASIICVKQNNSKTMISGILNSAMIVAFLMIASLFFNGRPEPSYIIIWGCMMAGTLSGLLGGRKHKIR